MAASGAMAANALIPVWKHLELLGRIRMPEKALAAPSVSESAASAASG